jgi:hypothetical protein
VLGVGVPVSSFASNLAFSGDIVVARRHTVHALRDLPKLLNAISKMHALWQRQDRQFELYKSSELADPQVNDLNIRALEYRGQLVRKHEA